MCANYEFKRLGSTGKFEVSVRHPGGKTIVGITDTPELYPRRFSEVPKAAGGLEHTPQMYPGYAGPVIRVRDGQPEAAALHWGFTPHWANKPIQNAQREKLTVSATWKSSFQTRRCLAPANAFFEWQARPGVRGKTRLRIHPVDLEVFCFAGLWQTFKGKDGQAIDCYTIVTTTPNEFMRAIHNRMPVILGPEAQERWMDTTNSTGEGLDELLGPYYGKLEAEPAE